MIEYACSPEIDKWGDALWIFTATYQEIEVGIGYHQNRLGLLFDPDWTPRAAQLFLDLEAAVYRVAKEEGVDIS